MSPTADTTLRSCIYRGEVTHARAEVARNTFRYRTCFFRLDLDELEQLDARLRTFSLNRRRAITSLMASEYIGGTSDEPLKVSVARWLVDQGVEAARDPDQLRIELVTNLGVFGYVFNPISCWYVHDAHSDQLLWMIAEVHNTFGERHRYLVDLGEQTAAADGANNALLTARATKQLHVSPFMPMQREYRFRIRQPGEQYFLGVDVFGGERPFTTGWTGTALPLTDANMLRTLMRYPLAPLMVTARIHWQALRLWRKKVPIFRKPPFIPGVGTVSPSAADDTDRASGGSHTPPTVQLTDGA